MSNPKSPWIAFHQPKPDAKLRLFCFPFAGGGASAYRLWNASLPDWIEVVPLQYPGREQRFSEPLIDRLDRMVEGIEAAILPLLDRPFAFYGHSMGSLVCFEAARSLRKNHGLVPECLMVASRFAPDFLLPPEHFIHQLSDDEFLAAVQVYGGIPAQVLAEPELKEMAIRILRHDYTVLETYQYQEEAPFDCPIVAYGGEEDVLGAEEALSTWKRHTTGAFRIQQMPGGHFFLNTHRQALLEDFAEELAAVRHQPRSLHP